MGKIILVTGISIGFGRLAAQTLAKARHTQKILQQNGTRPLRTVVDKMNYDVLNNLNKVTDNLQAQLMQATQIAWLIKWKSYR